MNTRVDGETLSLLLLKETLEVKLSYNKIPVVFPVFLGQQGSSWLKKEEGEGNQQREPAKRTSK